MNSQPRPLTYLSYTLALGLAVFAMAFVPNASAQDNNCTDDGTLAYEGVYDLHTYRENGTLEFSDFSQSGDRAAITVTNNSDCRLPLTLATYAMTGPNLTGQEKFADKSTTIASGNTETIQTELPGGAMCTTEIDLFYGTGAPQSFSDETEFVARLMATTFFKGSPDEFTENDSLSEDNTGYEDLDADNPYCSDVSVIKQVENTDHSNVNPDDFTVTLTQKNGAASYQFSGTENGKDLENIPAGTYQINEAGNYDYTTEYAGSCQSGELTVDGGENNACTITNTIETKPDPDKCEYADNTLPYGGVADLSDYIDEGTLEFSDFKQFGSGSERQAGITVTNNSNCKLPLALGVYKMFGNELSDQKLHGEDRAVINKKSSETLRADLPMCMAEIDLFYDANQEGAPQSFSDETEFVARLMATTFYENENDTGGFAENDSLSETNDGYENAGPSANFCPADSPEPDPAEATFTKMVDNENGSNFQPNDFTITLNQEDGPTEYEFRGSKNGKTIADMATGTYHITESTDTDANYSTDYSNTCTSGEITIESGDNITCQMTNDIAYNPTQPLSGSCDVTPSDVETGETVEWSGQATGGSSPYDYSWVLENADDVDNTRSTSVSYQEPGTYDGTVTIIDQNGHQVERTCTVDVDESEDDDDGGGVGGGGDILDPRDDDEDDDDGDVAGEQDVNFDIACEPESDSSLVGQTVTFTTDVDGDINEESLDYDWEDVDYLDANNESATVRFTSAGEKTVTVKAEYEDETERAECEVDINRAQQQAAGVQLNQVPYTGPADDLRTAGFITGFIVFALASGYLFIRRRNGKQVEVGIPQEIF